MHTYTEKNGYRWIAVVDSHTANELLKYGTASLVIVATPSQPKWAKYVGFSYQVYLKI